MAKKQIPDDCMPKCATCAFAELDMREGVGVCHRFPPIFVAHGEDSDFTFAGIASSDWCGEYKRRLQA